MPDKHTRYLLAADTGVELIKCEDSCLSYPLHNHASTYTIGMILSGNIQITFDEQKFSVYKNQFFIIPPYVPHSILANRKYTIITFCVHKDVIKQIDENRLASIATLLLSKAFCVKKIDIKQIISFLSAIFICKRHILTPVISVNYVEKLKQLIEQHPECSLTAKEMSRHAYISKYHLIRRFKQEIGLTPHQFQIQNRIRKAQRLLTQSSSITEVALAVGFFDQSHFIKHFKKIVGLTPSCYKSALQPIYVQ